MNNTVLRALAAVTLSFAFAHDTPAANVVVFVGDSLPYGFDPLNIAPSDGDQGYASLYADRLGRERFGGIRPDVVNLAIPGETTATYFNAGRPFFMGEPFWRANVNYTADTPQHDLLEQTLRDRFTAGDRVKSVVIQLGANDVLNLFDSPEFQRALATGDNLTLFTLLNTTILTAADRLTQIAQTARRLAPGAEIKLLNYYNPFEPISPAIDPRAAFAEPVIQGLNAAVLQAASTLPDPTGSFVDLYSLFTTPDGSRVAQWTNIVTLADIHPNARGFAEIAAIIPAPGSALIVTLLPLLAARRRRG